MIICTDVSCKHNNDNYKCTLKNIKLLHGSFNTVYQGRIERLKCCNYQESEEYKQIREVFKDIEIRKLKGGKLDG